MNERFLNLNKYQKKKKFNKITLISDIEGPVIIDNGMKLSK